MAVSEEKARVVGGGLEVARDTTDRRLATHNCRHRWS